MYIYSDKEKKPVLYKLLLIITGIILGIILTRILIMPVKIAGNSMSPGLKKGDIIFAFKYSTPRKGDVIIFKSPLQPEKILVKRIVGIQGDTIEIKDNNIFINNKKYLQYNYKENNNNNLTNIKNKKINIPGNEFFVLSDNNNYKFDSREFGLIKKSSIIGEVFLGI